MSDESNTDDIASDADLGTDETTDDLPDLSMSEESADDVDGDTLGADSEEAASESPSEDSERESNPEEEELLDAFMDTDPEDPVATRSGEGDNQPVPGVDEQSDSGPSTEAALNDIEQAETEDVGSDELEEAAANIWGDESLAGGESSTSADDSASPVESSTADSITTEKQDEPLSAVDKSTSPAAALSETTVDGVGDTTEPGTTATESASAAARSGNDAPNHPANPFRNDRKQRTSTTSSATPEQSDGDKEVSEMEKPLSEVRDGEYVKRHGRTASIFLRLARIPALIIGLILVLLAVLTPFYVISPGQMYLNTGTLFGGTIPHLVVLTGAHLALGLLFLGFASYADEHC
jgi:hypothetical protein